jgi:DNA (cytosine-5)-methyltransferase 1
MTQRGFYEFFAGGGMARAGLGQGWRCLFANDLDPKKARAYAANWGGEHFRLGDIHDLKPDDLPGHADLAWASFPCQDLSLAGAGAGLKGERSGAFWGFYSLMLGLRSQRRAPRILVIENVVGAITSNGGKDFEELCRALHSLGYVFGALTMDAAHFVPQSRPRLFIVAVRKDANIPLGMAVDEPDDAWASASLRKAKGALRPDLRDAWRWWRLPPPPRRNATLADLIELTPQGVEWHSPKETARLLGMMSEVNRRKVAEAVEADRRHVGTIYRRTRPDGDGAKTQRAEVRFDGVAGCLRTPEGGSSRQTVMIVEEGSVRTRLLSPREAARLMGLSDGYILPERYNEAYHLLGDGVAVPVVRFLAMELLASLATGETRLKVAAE